MKIDFIEGEYKRDLTGAYYELKGVQLNILPIEYLIISAALKQFVENSTNHGIDVEIAKQMREEIKSKYSRKEG